MGTGIPRRTGGLRLPDFWLMRDIVEWALRREPGPVSGEELRDHAYEGRRRRGLVLRTLWALGGQGGEGGAGGPGTGWLMFALRILTQPLLQFFPRWWWGRRRTRRLIRSRRHGWYAGWLGIGHGRSDEKFFDNIAGLVESVTRRGRETAVAQFEQLLLHALLADLKAAARPGRLSPWRRRRVTRFVVLLELPDGEETEPGAGAAARFLQEYAAAAEETSCAAVVVVAAGTAGSEPDGHLCTGLADAASRLDRTTGMPDRAPAPLLVPLPEPEPALGGRPVAPVTPKTFRVGPAAELALEGAVLVTVLSLLGGWLVPMWLGGDDAQCIGGSGTGAGSPPSTDPAPVTPREQYDAAREMIEAQNLRADRAAQEGKTARTVVHLGASVASGPDDKPGAVPELRGIALAQQALNDEAQSDDQKVWLRVRLHDTGVRFGKAVDAAEDIAAAAADDPEIIGVVGFAESRKETREAVRILGDAGIPMVGTTATADEMQENLYYRPMAPTNSRETLIEAEFARQAKIIENASGECAPAEAAVVIQDPTDLYSKGLGDGFAKQFGEDTWHKLWYSPNGRTGGPAEPDNGRTSWKDNIQDVAEAVCERVKQEPRTVVYWASRAREFTAFLNDFGDSTTCEGRKLTVLGGNELTNAALSGEYRDRPWLRLYHAAHVLPAGHPARSDSAQEFSDKYDQAFGEKDPWRNDGHAALAYDAMQAMASAANEVYTGTNGQEVGRSNVQTSLHHGISKEGASGYLDFGKNGRTVSRDKPLVILHHTADGSEPVLYCGAFAQNTGRITRWGPDGEFPCPTDG